MRAWQVLGVVLGCLVLALGLNVLVAWAQSTSCFPIGGGSCVRVAIPSGADPSRECIVGELFLDLNTSVDTVCTTAASNTLCCCTAANTWTECAN